MPLYWTPEHQKLIEIYYYAQFSGVTSGITRNECITKLYPVLKHLARLAAYSCSLPQTEENIQIIICRMIEYFLPHLKQEKIQAALYYLYISSRRYCLSKKRKKPMDNNSLDLFDTLDDNVRNSPDYNLNQEDLRREINRAIDIKIEKQRVINKSSTIFLINLKMYLLSNGFDPRGFKEFIMDRMSIGEVTYNNIISRLGIRSKVFNEKIIVDDKNNISDEGI